MDGQSASICILTAGSLKRWHKGRHFQPTIRCMHMHCGAVLGLRTTRTRRIQANCFASKSVDSKSSSRFSIWGPRKRCFNSKGWRIMSCNHPPGSAGLHESSAPFQRPVPSVPLILTSNFRTDSWRRDSEIPSLVSCCPSSNFA